MRWGKVEAKGPAPVAALPALDEHDKNGLLVASFAACAYKGVEVGIGNVLTWFSYLIVAGAVARLALGVSGATGDVGAIVAPAALGLGDLRITGYLPLAEHLGVVMLAAGKLLKNSSE